MVLATRAIGTPARNYSSPASSHSRAFRKILNPTFVMAGGEEVQYERTQNEASKRFRPVFPAFWHRQFAELEVRYLELG